MLVVAIGTVDRLVPNDLSECVVLYGTVFNEVKNTSRRAPHVRSCVPARWLSPAATLPDMHEV